MKATISIAAVVICLFFAACDSSKHPKAAAGTTKPEATAATSRIPQTAPTISATPNPVPTGSGIGTTTVSWTTGDRSNGQVYVSADGQAEQIFATAPQGSANAAWVQAGKSYEFRLYGTAGISQCGLGPSGKELRISSLRCRSREASWQGCRYRSRALGFAWAAILRLRA